MLGISRTSTVDSRIMSLIPQDFQTLPFASVTLMAHSVYPRDSFGLSLRSYGLALVVYHLQEMAHYQSDFRRHCMLGQR